MTQIQYTDITLIGSHATPSLVEQYILRISTTYTYIYIYYYTLNMMDSVH